MMPFTSLASINAGEQLLPMRLYALFSRIDIEILTSCEVMILAY